MDVISREGRTNVTDLAGAVRVCRGSFAFAGFFSLFVNLLMLVPSIYMLAVYDRVLASGSESTLLMLTLIMLFLYAVMGGLEWVRSQILVVTSSRLDRTVGRRVLTSTFAQALRSGGQAASSQPLGDLLQVRQFLTGHGLFAFFDAPWLPIYVAILFAFHPWFGAMALAAVVVLAMLAIFNEVATQGDLQHANQRSIEISQFTQRNLRNVEAIEAMGMLPRIAERWQGMQDGMLMLQTRASGRGGVVQAISRTFRVTVQSLMLGAGAYLVIHKQLTPGAMIAGSILLGRAMAPLDAMIANWRGFIAARQAYKRLNMLLRAQPPGETPMPLPAPSGHIGVDGLIVSSAPDAEPILKGLNFSIESGDVVAVIGPSGAGKSTLARAILGLMPTLKGYVRFDGADVRRCDRTRLGEHIGYVPQDVELLDGTIAENIARFGLVDSARVIEAAQVAGIHDMILKLPKGYETRLVSGGKVLSAGQQQRLAIARALYRMPRIIVMDEPNSNLDQAGENALVATVRQLKQQGSTVLLVTHRPNILAEVDKVLLLLEGRLAMYGPRDEVFTTMAGEAIRPSPSTARAVAVATQAASVQPSGAAP